MRKQQNITAEDFFTLAPQYRTKVRLNDLMQRITVETAHEILLHLDELEIKQPEDLKTDNWRNWKYIRNSIVDKYEIPTQQRVPAFEYNETFYSYEQEWETLQRMTTFGGSFVKQLRVLYECGDPSNQAKLRTAFQSYFITYRDWEEAEQKKSPSKVL